MSGIQLLGGNGGRGRDRTYDQSIKSRMLYQLSYASIMGYTLRDQGALRKAIAVSRSDAVRFHPPLENSTICGLESPQIA
jgi:hypothetical protein